MMTFYKERAEAYGLRALYKVGQRIQCAHIPDKTHCEAVKEAARVAAHWGRMALGHYVDYDDYAYECNRAETVNVHTVQIGKSTWNFDMKLLDSNTPDQWINFQAVNLQAALDEAFKRSAAVILHREDWEAAAKLGYFVDPETGLISKGVA